MIKEPSADTQQQLHRWFAVEANNAAWALAETSSRTPLQDEQLLHLAHTAAWHWQQVGTSLHQARARLLLGLVHGQLGHAGVAAAMAAEASAVIKGAAGQEVDAWELALLAVVEAAVAFAVAEPQAHLAAHAAATTAVAGLADPEERAIVQASLATLPVPDAS